MNTKASLTSMKAERNTVHSSCSYLACFSEASTLVAGLGEGPGLSLF